MYRASHQEIQDLISTAEALSKYYHEKYPAVSTDEFLSISQQAIGEALERYDPKRGKLKSRVKKFIYDRFHNFLKKQKTFPRVSPPYIPDASTVIDEVLDCGWLTEKQETAILYFLKNSEVPPNRMTFYRAVKTIREKMSGTKTPFFLHMYVGGREK